MPQELLPVCLVILAFSIMPSWHISRRWLSVALAAGFAALLLRYFHWRLFVTVLPADDLSAGSLVVWTVFLVELLAWAETLILLGVILRRTDRSAQADIYERRLRAKPPDSLPQVDVFIATYNEPLEVLEKTIAGAMALDWPAERLNICVLDDGRRDWLAAYCAARGVTHMTRNDNRNAKAGNINAAIAVTSGAFILVLDADFVPTTRLLMRAMGFFRDPRVGIVQMPHHFFNGDPVQTSLNMESTLPDEQRFFFDVIQPGRDGWGCAFCCGSNGIIRRSALKSIGGAMPTDSITEDMLLTLSLMRKGYVTRYLNERLAIGLAPENLDAYFLQRARWAQGAIQIMFLRNGPFGPGLNPIQRLLFVPSHWISQSICQPVAVAVPAFFLLTGIPPIINATVAGIFSFQVPAVVAGIALMKHLAPDKFAPLSATAQALLQAFRIMPVVVSTLVNPNGHAFKVTPKGADARVGVEDRFTILTAMCLILLTGFGLYLNADFATRIVAEDQLLPVVTFWAIANMIVLMVVVAIAIPRPIFRSEERFLVREPCRLDTEAGTLLGDTENISLSGALIHVGGSGEAPPPDTWLAVGLPRVGAIPAVVRRRFAVGGQTLIGVSFVLPSGQRRDRLIQKLFASGAPLASQGRPQKVWVTLLLLTRIFKPKETLQTAHAAAHAAAGDDIGRARLAGAPCCGSGGRGGRSGQSAPSEGLSRPCAGGIFVMQNGGAARDSPQSRLTMGRMTRNPVRDLPARRDCRAATMCLGVIARPGPGSRKDR